MLLNKQEKEKLVRSLKNTISDTELRKKIQEIYGVKKTQGNAIFNKFFNSIESKMTEVVMENIIKEKRKGGYKIFEDQLAIKAPQFKQSNDAAVAESIDENVKTLDDLLKICEVDLNEWKVEKFIVNKWATARKNKVVNLNYNNGKIDGEINDKGGMVVQPLYQVKAWLVKRKETKDREFIVDQLKKALNDINSKSFEASPEKDGFLYEIAIPDIHMGKLVWKDEIHNGENYNSTIAGDLFKKAVATLISRVNIQKVSRILLPIGNDFYNSDNAEGTTTAGTKMTEDSRWQDTFVKGARLVVEVVEYLSTFAPVDVIIVSGNHDNERSFYLGEYVSAWFKNHPSITINNSPTARKYYKWNKVLIGMTHGNEEKHSDLPLTMATERPQDWAECKHKYMQLGHTHKKDWEDIKGVQVHTISSLCACDYWHSKKAYVGSLKTAEGFLFDPEEGLIADYYFRA